MTSLKKTSRKIYQNEIKKENEMKYLVIIMMTILVTTISAQSAKSIHNAPANFKMGLSSENTGLVESMIYVAAKYHYNHPEVEFDRVMAKIKDLVKNGKSERIRYKAFLAAQYMQNYEMFGDMGFAEVYNPDTFFKRISDDLQKYYLTYSDR